MTRASDRFGWIVLALLLFLLAACDTKDEQNRDGDMDAEGDSPPFSDYEFGDYPPTDGDLESAETDEAELTEQSGMGVWPDSPLVHEGGRAPVMSREGRLESLANNLDGSACADAPLDEGESDGEAGGPGAGNEVVVLVMPNAGELLQISFSGAAFDALIYILEGPTSAPTCVAYMDAAGMSQIENLSFIAPKTKDYYIILDSKNPGVSSGYSYYITLSNPESEGDGDRDADMPDTPDGDSPPTDGDTDGGELSEPDSDMDLTDSQESIEKEKESGGPYTLSVVAFELIPADPQSQVVPPFTDLAWEKRPTPTRVKTDSEMEGGDAESSADAEEEAVAPLAPYALHLLADHGTYAWDWGYDNQEGRFKFLGEPRITAEASAFRGVMFDGTTALWLDRTNRKISGTAHGDILLGGAIGPEVSGLTRFGEDVLLTESSMNILFRYTWQQGSGLWAYSYTVLGDVVHLVGITTINGELFVLDSGSGDSRILKLDPATYTTKVVYIVPGRTLSGIAYNNETGLIWASDANEAKIVALSPLPE